MGFLEVLLVVLLLVVFFGASRLPTLGAALGKTVRSFKDAANPPAPPPGDGKGGGSPPPDPKG